MSQFARLFIIGGLAVAAFGLLLLAADKLGFGKLPGDIVWRKKNVTVYFPIISSVVLSLVLTLLYNLWLGRK